MQEFSIITCSGIPIQQPQLIEQAAAAKSHNIASQQGEQSGQRLGAGAWL